MSGKTAFDKFELKQKKQVDEICFHHCFKVLTTEIKSSQENCLGKRR